MYAPSLPTIPANQFTLWADETPITDPLCFDLAAFLKEGLNREYPEKQIVRSIREYDAYDVPFNDFPLLKVYRLIDTFNTEDPGKIENQLQVSYCLVNVDIQDMPGIAYYISRKMVRHLLIYSATRNTYKLFGQIQSRYRTMLQLNQLIYQVDLNFNVRE